jgi:hypothetical protein
MKFTSHVKPSLLEMFIDKYFNDSSIVAPDTGDFTFPPSANFVKELKDSFTLAKIEKYENGGAFSAYVVKYNIGGHNGEAIYKTTNTTYPDFLMYDDVEEYEMSFSLND